MTTSTNGDIPVAANPALLAVAAATQPEAVSAPDLTGHFQFVVGGVRHVMPKPTVEVFTPDFVRRTRDEQSGSWYTLFESLAGPEQMAAYRKATWPEHRAIWAALDEHTTEIMGASLGE